MIVKSSSYEGNVVDFIIRCKHIWRYANVSGHPKKDTNDIELMNLSL